MASKFFPDGYRPVCAVPDARGLVLFTSALLSAEARRELEDRVREQLSLPCVVLGPVVAKTLVLQGECASAKSECAEAKREPQPTCGVTPRMIFWDETDWTAGKGREG